MRVPRTTEGKFQKGSAALFSSEGMVTFGQSIRNDQWVSSHQTFKESLVEYQNL